jgi:hypothetical protein
VRESSGKGTGDERKRKLGCAAEASQAATIGWEASNYTESMKALLSVILFATVAFAQGVSPTDSSPQIPVDQENAHKARALLEQAIQALGGQAYLSIQDVSQEGRTYSFFHGQPSSFGVQFWRFYKFPDKDRVELTKKRDVVYVNNGDKGYEITYKGTRSAEAKDLTDYNRRRQFALDRILRNWIDEPGMALFYEGPAVAEDKPADRVTLINAKNQGVTIDIDSNTHLPLKKSYNWRDATDKERNVEEEVYDNYRPMQGIMTPFSVIRYYNGEMSSERFLTLVTYNTGVPDSKFDAQITYGPK